MTNSHERELLGRRMPDIALRATTGDTLTGLTLACANVRRNLREDRLRRCRLAGVELPVQPLEALKFIAFILQCAVFCEKTLKSVSFAAGEAIIAVIGN